MTTKELNALQDETIEVLRKKAKAGDVKAADVLLKALRRISRDIAAWQLSQPKQQPPQ